ncbi:hypothetical protein SGLAM104S_08283 [Streptomyces glaucescens]
MQINALIVDAADPERLATFWSQLLAGRSWAAWDPMCGCGARTAWAWASSEPASPSLRRTVCTSTSPHPDPPAEQRRVEALGGRRLEEYDAGGFLVMADPEGNEFCIIPEGPFELDDEGRANYLL